MVNIDVQVLDSGYELFELLFNVKEQTAEDVSCWI